MRKAARSPLSERVLTLEHDIMGNGSIGLKERMEMLEKEVKHLQKTIYIGFGGISMLMFLLKLIF